MGEDLDSIADSFRLVSRLSSFKGEVSGFNFSFSKSVIEIFGDLSPAPGFSPMFIGLLRMLYCL